ncbi:hypothetical protein ACFL14_02365 [Patescibacteria group bacterium]
MIIQSNKILKYYLHKQLFSSPLSGDSSILDVINKTGFPKEQNALLSFYLRKQNFQKNDLLQKLKNNEIIEVKTFKNKRLLVPKKLARNLISLIPKKQDNLRVKSSAKLTYQKLKNEPLNQTQIVNQIQDYSSDIIKLSLEYLESTQKIMKIYNFSENKFEFVLTQDILEPDLSQESDKQILAKIIHLIIQYYGPLKLSDLVKYTGIDSIKIQKSFKYIRNNIASIKIDKSQSLYLIDGKDLSNLQNFKSPSLDTINIVPKTDHAFSLSQGWLYKSIPMYSKLDMIVVFNGDVVGGFSSLGGFDSFVSLPKLVLNEISNKHISLLQWIKRKLV